ncbi:MAG TPA: hypothetical protein VGO98_01255, partial [Candidatus Saccharimonadales bacterium]|nr:hypothetical protein [Candidatus Saccharimonadales bacterium]
MLQPDDHETVRFVCEELGPTLTAALSGTRNRLDVDAWMKAGHDHITPTDDQLNRLRFAHSLFQRAIDKKGEDIGTRSTRAWFLGGNVGPELDTPMTAI